jgi:hypothetical protein
MWSLLFLAYGFVFGAEGKLVERIVGFVVIDFVVLRRIC